MDDPEQTREVAADAAPPRPAARDATLTLAPPHASRLAAFGLDLLIVGAVGLAVGGGLLQIFTVFVAYHTVLVWLTGQTVGKAVANLEVRRVDGGEYVRTTRGLLWALGRASLGYLLVDVLGLGLLVALWGRNRARRCAHDWVFSSQVVHRGEHDWALPSIRERLSDFARRREEASKKVEEAQEEPRRLVNLWHWLITGALALEKLFDWLQRGVEWLSRRFSGTQPVEASASLSTKAATGVAAGTIAGTVGVVAAAATLLGGTVEASPLGHWGDGRFLVEESGPDFYVGTVVEDMELPRTGCVYEAGTETWRLRGAGPRYEGEVLWAQGDGTTCFGFDWGVATFELLDQGTPDPIDDIFQSCSTDPFTGREECHDYSRG